ncbi:hypothetical protein Sjap_016016 [Stephania japonica]|uniref:Uncharacterized protein n=1 Tax=Stephania japonica TaxID=461633 RepID=A0AAP0NT31_9MAGN
MGLIRYIPSSSPPTDHHHTSSGLRRIIMRRRSTTSRSTVVRNQALLMMMRRRRWEVRMKVRRLQKLVPGGRELEPEQLFLEAAKYILQLRVQVNVLQALSKLYKP